MSTFILLVHSSGVFVLLSAVKYYDTLNIKIDS